MRAVSIVCIASSVVVAASLVVGCDAPVAEGEGDDVGEGEGDVVGEGEGDVVGEGEGEGDVGGEGEGDVDACVFASSFNLMRKQRSLPLLDDRRETAPSGLSSTEQAQLLASLAAGGDSDVASIDDAFARVDQGEVRLVKFWSLTNDAPFDVVEYGRGDTSVGAVFVGGTADVAATISDGEVGNCVVFAGDGGGACDDDGDCGGAHVCQDVVCVPAAYDADGRACVDVDDCDGGRCVDGACDAGFHAGSFADADLAAAGSLAIPDPGVLVRTFAVNGLADAVTDVHLFLLVFHDDVSTLSVTLTSPSGDSVVVARDATGGAIVFDEDVSGFDGAANGDWVVTLADDVEGGAGQLFDIALRVGSDDR